MSTCLTNITFFSVLCHMHFWSSYNSWIFCLEVLSIIWPLPTLNGFISYYFSPGHSQPFVLLSTYQIPLFAWNFKCKLYSFLSGSLSSWQITAFFKSDLKHLLSSAFLCSSCIPLLWKLFYILVVPRWSPLCCEIFKSGPWMRSYSFHIPSDTMQVLYKCLWSE